MRPKPKPDDWSPPPPPPSDPLLGRFVTLQPLDPEADAEAVFYALGNGTEPDVYRHAVMGGFTEPDGLRDALRGRMGDGIPFRIDDAKTGEALGLISYLRIRPNHGSAEIGGLAYGPALRRTPGGTEAVYLLLARLFETGYRRAEWKCDTQNETSKRAATRYGFTFEGVFRQDMMIRGGNRDTAWYSIIDREWPPVRQAFEAWLSEDNFTEEGEQKEALAALRDRLRAS
ncbi:GNAT family N-acetyltransferase [Parvularcula dongshanensis]|uniref:RimJ/RimL family protein N-acetyltransferase n=1 Tax=Parvularcula dongshanensis TaxID=1173995 RepID=A0A840HZH6_9PROT|nr:GNAT family protein [Parvularcula dongshanensis]MBB4658246.1 RimJ/RimL family protein N-acetyltransferase [Parvularcula dongshanensis]